MMFGQHLGCSELPASTCIKHTVHKKRQQTVALVCVSYTSRKGSVLIYWK